MAARKRAKKEHGLMAHLEGKKKHRKASRRGKRTKRSAKR